jgi:DNA-binding XRE family transcriptional regulator
MSSTKNKTGRPSKYDPKYCEEMINYMATGRSYEAFAGYIGVSKVTLYAWEKEHKDFMNAKRVARQKCHQKLEEWGEKLIKGEYKGNASMLIFMMKNMTGWRDQPVMDDDDAIDGVEFVNED